MNQSIAKTLITLALFLFLMPCSNAQTIDNSIGIVTLTKAYDESNKELKILNKNGSVWKTIDCFCLKGHSNKKCLKREKKLDIVSYGFKTLKVKCLAKENGRYTVMFNEKSPKIKYIEFSDYFKFQTWEEYILGATTIGFNPDSGILDTIAGTKIYPNENERAHFFKPIETKGYWLKVKWDKNQMNENNPEYRYGWLKWRDEEKITVSPLYLR